MENRPRQEPEVRSLTGREANDVCNGFREPGVQLPSGVLGVGAQRLGESSGWAITVFTANPEVDASDFIQQHLPGIQVFVEQPGVGEAYPS